MARLVVGIKSHGIRKILLCIQDLTLGKAVNYIQVDESTSSQADKLLKLTRLESLRTGKRNFPITMG